MLTLSPRLLVYYYALLIIIRAHLFVTYTECLAKMWLFPFKSIEINYKKYISN